ncbi:MAG: hypothetical protein HY824_07240 [Acidobacteria bacterium]|nr:hypothetical protein [Acidobacteriota bacterium]
MDAWRAAAAALVADLTHVFAGRLRSVVAYGRRLDGDDTSALTCLALVDSLGLSDLEACARLSPAWARRHLATPLLLSEEEFRRSLDAFPLEYSEILRTRERVFGGDPFDEAAIAREDLRRACETQVKSHLVHLRESFIEAAGRPQAIAALVTSSAPAFAALLRHAARLSGSTIAGRVDATREGARAAGLSDTVVNDILALEHRPAVPMTDAARLFPEYLAAVEQLARAVDGWRG